MTAAGATEPVLASPDLVTLYSDWSIWSLVGLRSAGFDAERITALTGESAQVTAGLAAFAADARFIEALTWQNPSLVRDWLDADTGSLRTGGEFQQMIVARYAQRYTTKNDTIGFFGPVGWATVDLALDTVLTLRGTGAEKRRSSHLEAWAVELLAETWASDPELRAHLPPRRDPTSIITDHTMFRARGPAVSLAPDEERVLLLADGRTTPAEIFGALTTRHPELGFESRTEVLSLLATLSRRRLLRWGFHLPLDERMEQHLAGQIAAVPDEVVRERYLAPLTELLSARAAVDAAVGNGARLAALDVLGQRFEKITAHPARRPKSDSPTGHGLLWLDTTAHWEVKLGRAAVRDLGPPLAMPLDACRWLTAQVADGIEKSAAGIVSASADRRLAVAKLLAELTGELTGCPGGVLDRAVREMQRRAEAVLPIDPAARAVFYRSANVGAAWAAQFATTGPAWEAARVHSPDVMLASPGGLDGSAEAFWVLGEIHVAVNTLDSRALVVNEPHPGLVASLVAASTRGTRYVPAFARGWPGVGPRGYPPLTTDVAGRFVYWATEPHDTLPVTVERVPTAGLDAVLYGNGVEVTDHAGFRAPFVEFAGELLSFLVGNSLRLYAARPFIPRVTVDRLVIQRATWHIPAADLPSATQRAAAACFAARLRSLGSPRYVFVLIPGERKPLFCDLNSDLLLRTVARVLRRMPPDSDAVRVQEMLPAFDQLWLRSAHGLRTCEFRFAVVDGRERSGNPA